jgi:hypothetical protein
MRQRDPTANVPPAAEGYELLVEVAETRGEEVAVRRGRVRLYVWEGAAQALQNTGVPRVSARDAEELRQALEGEESPVPSASAGSEPAGADGPSPSAAGWTDVKSIKRAFHLTGGKRQFDDKDLVLTRSQTKALAKLVGNWGQQIPYSDFLKAAGLGRSEYSEGNDSAHQLKAAIKRALKDAGVPAKVENVRGYGYKIVVVLPS